jgi:prolyl 4-hydroxylase
MILLSKDPKVYYLQNILSLEEANYFIELGEKYKTESILTRDHNKLVDTNRRNSSTAYLTKGMNDIVEKVEKRISDLLDVHYNRIEPLQIIVYEKDQYFKPHLDTFYENSVELNQGGNRTDTIFIYLNDLDKIDGGKTYFHNLNMKFQPNKCDGLYFQNMINGKIDNRLFHEGEKIVSNKKKYAMNIWIREKEYWSKN